MLAALPRFMENRTFDHLFGCHNKSGIDGIPAGGHDVPKDPKDPSKGQVTATDWGRALREHAASLITVVVVWPPAASFQAAPHKAGPIYKIYCAEQKSAL